MENGEITQMTEKGFSPEEVIENACHLSGETPDEQAADVLQAMNALIEQYPALVSLPAVETVNAYFKGVQWLEEWGTNPTDPTRSYFRYHVDEQGKYRLDASGLQR